MAHPTTIRQGHKNSKLQALLDSNRNRTLLVAAAILFLPRAQAQTSLPAAQPTQVAPQLSQPAAKPNPHHLQVLYSAGVLTVHAENSSLNGILREVSRMTGMSVTGGVQDERVYGNYGPADTGTVLETLLAGTGSNMLLEESTADRPLTLVLTPRQGGPTPPSPASYTQEPGDDRDQADLPPQQTRPGGSPTVISPQNGLPVALPLNGQPAAATTTPPAAATTTNQQSPNGVKTPQQIFDQLMKLKQQQTATPAPQ